MADFALLNGRDRFAFSTVVFVRLFALVQLVAFASAWMQIQGLVGPHGIAPATDYFAAVKHAWGASAFWRMPTLCWGFGAGGFLNVLGATGCVAAVLLFAGVAPVASLVVLWVAYLSLMQAGQMFFGYQWDSLLLETTLLAVWIVPWRWLPLWRAEEPPRIARLLVWWLTFRLMFLAGVVKLASGDPSWRGLTALTFHYETQPLPTPLAWYAHQAPLAWHKFECLTTFLIELAVPFLLWLPRKVRHVAALILAAFMGAIALTGNYTFFNALAIFLCLYCIDDAAWARLVVLLSGSAADRRRSHFGVTTAPTGTAENAGDGLGNSEKSDNADRAYPLVSRKSLTLPRTIRERLTWVFAMFAFGYTGALVAAALFRLGAPPGFGFVARYVGPFESFNNYGLFANMTNPRPELIIEGSYDGRDWHPYELPYKPGDLGARPKFVAPLQPRLDWQLWFAALEAPDQNPWMLSLCEHLLRGTPEVLRLLGKNPFADRPPKFIRVVRYEYHFTDRSSRDRTGNWWRRTPMDIYIPASSLR